MNLKQQATGDSFQEPLSSDPTSTPSFPAYQNPGLKGTHTGTPFQVKPVKIRSKMLARAINQAQRAKQSSHRYGL